MANFPDDFEAQLAQLRRNAGPLIKLALILIGLVIVITLAMSCWYTVDTDQKAVVLRFGDHYKDTGPGLHFKLPFGADKVYKVAVTREWTQQFGYRRQPQMQQRQRVKDESIMVSGDLAIANVEWATLYTIDDPYNYLFKVRSPEQTFRDLNESVMRKIVGDRTVSEVRTRGRQEIAEKAEDQLQELVDDYSMGIEITSVQPQDVNPPDAVVDAFEAVNQAQQEAEQVINEAYRDQNKVIPKAKGQAKQMIQEARGYEAQRVNEALGAANRFNAVFTEYAKHPEVTRTRLYLETMQEVLGTVGSKVILDEATPSLLPTLNLNSDKIK